MVKEAITLYLESMLDDGLEFPEPTVDIDRLKNNPDFSDAVLWAAVDVEIDWKRPNTTAA